MKEGLIALNYECSKCNERMGLYERKSAVLDGDFEWVCSTITSQNIYGRTPMILLTMRPSRLFVKIRCHAVASTRKRSAVRNCQVIYSRFGFAIHQNDHQARRRFVEWAQNEIAVVPDFHKRFLFSDEAHFWLNGYVNKQNCRIWSEANPQVYVETPLHPEKLTVWCALWAGGILLQKR
ncbi:hypothetical protein TNCV_1735471 [Trichonephila clavipes]|nr:hypothetical protein TNCV_1735471 [Trichonephila clavipes]